MNVATQQAVVRPARRGGFLESTTRVLGRDWRVAWLFFLPSALLLGGLSGNAICKALNSANPSECNSKGYYTPVSWGYRLRAVEEYSDVFAGVNLKPNITFSHDVRGNGPTFTEGSKAISIGVDADYLTKYTASLSYTNFFGGDYNTTTDRDFVALSVGVSF